MSTPEVRQKYVRSNRKKKLPLNVDLNVPPQEAMEEMGMQAGNSQQAVTETHVAETHVAETHGASASGNGNGSGSGSGSGAPANQAPPTIDLEEIDDEVVISSPRRFNEARKKNRRNQIQNQNVPVGNREVAALIERERSNPGFADEDITVLSLNASVTRRRIPSVPTVIDCDRYIDLESNYGMRGVRSREPVLTMHPPPPPPPPPAPREPIFNCPVCMGPLVEEMSTKCGHIFCKQCIKAAISAQNKCPTCRRKLNARDVLRVYLPATS